ncbi:hypothetical protein BTW28_08570 [Citrobacter freundii]|nr:hypothetical protein BTW28_08570 [Citrobacter freundii]AVH83779.1 hypothetical protein A6J81_25500 [Citrobacter braakii]
MTECCIPQQNPALYPFTHRVIHKPHDRFCDPLFITASFNRNKKGSKSKIKNSRALRKRFRYNAPAQQGCPVRGVS